MTGQRKRARWARGRTEGRKGVVASLTQSGVSHRSSLSVNHSRLVDGLHCIVLSLSPLSLAIMRSPILAIFLVAAAIATASAQSLPSRSSPTLQGGAGSFHMKTPRQYPSETHGGHDEPSREIDRQRSDQEREHAGGKVDDRPPIPRPSNALPFAPQGEKGGNSVSLPATGADAGQGGGSTSSVDGSPASGEALDKVGSVVTSTPLSQGSAAEEDSYAFHPQDSAYAYRMKRVARSDPGALVYRREDILDPATIVDDAPGSNDGDSSNNSNQDGADGQSTRGKETEGDGPDDGKAHSGEVGSSEGGHVYNYPASDGNANK
ncbi:hypothetical protein C8T65DRAFT_824661 [Cerioporus squamosus]|nr:hypothetical protein C8T65DRAFT_824661 [Cerioporus squamosus]